MNNGIKENSYKNIKSKYILQKIFADLTEKKLLQIVNYNKELQNELEKDINDFIKYYKKVIIEIIPINKEEDNYFIKYKKEEEQYFQIYFNDEKEEKHRNYFTKNDNVTNIKIIIDEHITSFEGLFYEYKCIQKINFIKFKRKDINNMSSMFCGCSSLKELNLLNFNTNNVTNMSYMFYHCSSLEKLNLHNFNTNNVTNMRKMFCFCSSLIQLNLNNFNTNKVTDMICMFSNCSDYLQNMIRKKYSNIRKEAFVYIHVEYGA